MISNRGVSGQPAGADMEAGQPPPSPGRRRTNGTIVAAIFIAAIIVIAALNYGLRHSNGHDVHLDGARDVQALDAA